jgi:hypothetical protein
MNVGRIVLYVTCAVVTVMCGAFALLNWDNAVRWATVIAALAAVAAIGVAVWAAIRGPAGVRASNTGSATVGPGGTANTGVRGRVDSVKVNNTGDAKAGRDGEANTGISLD